MGVVAGVYSGEVGMPSFEAPLSEGLHYGNQHDQRRDEDPPAVPAVPKVASLRARYRPEERKHGNERQLPIGHLAKGDRPFFIPGRLGTDRSTILERPGRRLAEPIHQCGRGQHDEDEALIKERVREYHAAREDFRRGRHDLPVEGQKEEIERREHRSPDEEDARSILIDEAPALARSDRNRSSLAP